MFELIPSCGWLNYSAWLSFLPLHILHRTTELCTSPDFLGDFLCTFLSLKIIIKRNFFKFVWKTQSNLRPASQRPQQLGLVRTEASLEFSLSLLHGWQKPSCLSHCLLLSTVWISRKLESKIEPGWGQRWGTARVSCCLQYQHPTWDLVQVPAGLAPCSCPWESKRRRSVGPCTYLGDQEALGFDLAQLWPSCPFGK